MGSFEIFLGASLDKALCSSSSSKDKSVRGAVFCSCVKRPASSLFLLARSSHSNVDCKLDFNAVFSSSPSVSLSSSAAISALSAWAEISGDSIAPCALASPKLDRQKMAAKHKKRMTALSFILVLGLKGIDGFAARLIMGAANFRFFLRPKPLLITVG